MSRTRSPNPFYSAPWIPSIPYYPRTLRHLAQPACHTTYTPRTLKRHILFHFICPSPRIWQQRRVDTNIRIFYTNYIKYPVTHTGPSCTASAIIVYQETVQYKLRMQPPTICCIYIHCKLSYCKRLNLAPPLHLSRLHPPISIIPLFLRSNNSNFLIANCYI